MAKFYGGPCPTDPAAWQKSYHWHILYIKTKYPFKSDRLCTLLKAVAVERVREDDVDDPHNTWYAYRLVLQDTSLTENVECVLKAVENWEEAVRHMHAVHQPLEYLEPDSPPETDA